MNIGYNVVTNNKNENPKFNYICYNIIIQIVNLLQNTIIYKYKNKLQNYQNLENNEITKSKYKYLQKWN